MNILVCPLSRVHEQVAKHRPARVISLLDPDWEFPELGTEYAGRHLRLRLHDVHEPRPGYTVPALEHIRELLQFLIAWNEHSLLVHCRAGIGRSTATAYIAACFKCPDLNEHDLALTLRQTAPLARPNEALVSLADHELGRKGRMSEAIRTTGRDLPWIEVSENVPFCFSLARAS